MNEDGTERALRESLRAPALSAEALQRIRRATEAEWRASLAQRPARHWWPAVAAASVVAVALVAAGIALEPWAMRGGDPLGQVARTQAPGITQVRNWWPDAAVAGGASLRTGQQFDVQGAGLVSLPAGGNLRIAPATQLEVIAANSVKLAAGEMYIDIPAGTQSSANFTVITSAGEFRHVGTQFALAVAGGATRLRVREGRVQWLGVDGDSTVDAGTELLIDRDQKVTRRVIDSSSADWSWTEALTPDIDIENKPLADFLDWVSRETGRKLVIADAATHAQIAAIRTHGDVRGLTAMQALTAVMASTSLHLDVSAGAIRVSFARETSRPPG